VKLNVKSLKDVEIGIPIIAEGVYHARIDKVGLKENNKGDGNNLVIMYRILDNSVYGYKDGKEIVNRGQVCVTRNYSMVPTPDYDPDKAMKELAVAVKHPPEDDLEDSHLLNKIVMIKVEHKEEQKDTKTGKTYPEGNDVRRVTPLPDDDTFTPPPF